MEDLLLLFLSLIIISLLTFICMAILPVPIYILPSSIIILSFSILKSLASQNSTQKLLLKVDKKQFNQNT